MKRIFAGFTYYGLFPVLLCLIASLLGMWGCEKDLEELEPNGQKVVFWYQYTQDREQTLLEMVEDFNSSNPYSIEVEARYAGHYPDIYNKMMDGLRGGSLPQLVVAYHNQAWAYYQNDGVVDLAPYMNSPKWGIPEDERAEYIEDLLKLDSAGGVQVAFRPHFSTELLYYNADWLAELGYLKPPRDWDEFAKLCRLARKQPFSRSTRPERSVGFLLGEDASRHLRRRLGRVQVHTRAAVGCVAVHQVVHRIRPAEPLGQGLQLLPGPPERGPGAGAVSAGGLQYAQVRKDRTPGGRL